MKNRKVLILISLIILFILLIIGVNLLLKSMNTENKTNMIDNNSIINEIEKPNSESDYIKIVDEQYQDNQLKYSNDITEYFTIKTLTNKYINLIGSKNKEGLKKVLSPSYIKKYNITYDNILKIDSIPKIKNEKQTYRITISKMTECKLSDNIHIYIVSGKGRIVGQKDIFNFNLMIEVDNASNLYNIYPYRYMQDKGYTKLKIGNTINYEIEELSNRGGNSFNVINKTEKDLAREYFDNYKELMFYYESDAYNRLNSEYKRKRFGSIEKFNNYLKENKKIIATMSIKEYKVEESDGYKNYICSDQYRNIVTFKSLSGITNYSVLLDNYTIFSKEILERYNQLDDFNKAKYNLSNFIKKINTKDYDSIYNNLNSNFKNSNFKSVNELRNYLKKNLYEINSIEIEETDNQKTNNYFVFNCKITNQMNTDESKKMTVIIKILKDTNFEMSFNIK